MFFTINKSLIVLPSESTEKVQEQFYSLTANLDL